MITVFNRRELYVTYDSEKKSKVRALLAKRHIPYYVKTINQQERRQRTLGINLDYDYEYIIYVHKKDYPEAMYILNQERI